MKNLKHQVITMDGPAASGKSSVASRVAEKLDWVFVNTGNMYRAATLAALRAGVDVKNPPAVVQAVQAAQISVRIDGSRSQVALNGEVLEAESLSAEEVNLAVSHVAAVPEIRQQLVNMQRQLLEDYDLVMEGRDIGTVVFPETPWKFYIDASEQVRAARRGLQGQSDAVSERDRLDTTRKVAPLKAAPDATVIDSTEMSLQEVVDVVFKHLRERGFAAL